MSDNWLNAEEAAKRVHRSKRTIYQWASDGIVRTIKPGRKLWFSLPDLLKADKDQKQGRPRRGDLP